MKLQGAWGHVLLVGTRLELDKKIYSYHCECGHTWDQEKKVRMWHCGGLECPFLPRRKRQEFLPKKRGRPNQYDRFRDHEDESDSPYRNRVTFTLPPYFRDDFENMCMVLHVSKSEALREMTERWIKENRNAYEKALVIRYTREGRISREKNNKPQQEPIDASAFGL